ncbi:MAG: hypothetical protein KKA73_12690, partial [Chloroflexi bacterium]|nr:hypothetical protein [Chloroflexota bacterium]
MSWLDALFDPADLARFLDDDDDDDGDWPVPTLAKAAGARRRKRWYEQPFGFVVGLADDLDGQPDLAQAQSSIRVAGRTLAQAKRQAARWYNRQESRQRLPALRP